MIKKILVSQPEPVGVSPYNQIVSQFGVSVVFRPFIKVIGISEEEFREQRVNFLNYTAVVFTSRYAIDNYFKMAQAMKINIPETMKYFCVSETISLYIQKYVHYRKRKVFFSETGKLIDLLPIMAKHKNEKYLIPISNVHNSDTTTLLDQNQLNYKEVVLYNTVSNNFQKDEQFDYDMVVLFSPTGVETLLHDFPDINERNVAIATFGPTTTQHAKELNLNLAIEAPTSDCPSMPTAIQQYLKKHQS